MTDALTSRAGDEGADEYVAQLRTLLETAHALWSAPEERRRMRFFGFRPAVEPGVLKREWHGMGVRVSGGSLRVARAGAAEIVYRAEDRALLLDGAPFVPTPEANDVVRQTMDLVQAYERWVEAREGRRERISRGQGDDDRRPRNALAETRRLQRLMQVQRPRR